VALFSSLDISWSSPENSGEHRAIKDVSPCFRIANAKTREGTEQETQALFRARVPWEPRNGSRIDRADCLVPLNPSQTKTTKNDAESRFDHFLSAITATRSFL
jgi:hypothetical protein